MNLPTLPTQAPRRTPAGAFGSLAASSARSFASESGESTAPARSGITPERSAIEPSANTRPGRSAPAAPKRTSFKRSSLVSGGRQAGRADRFELLVGEDEFLVTERFGFRKLAPGELLHQAEDLAADVVEPGALQDAPGVHVHVVRHALVRVRVGANLDDRRDRGTDHRAAARGEQDQVRAAGDQLDDLGV